MKFYVLAQQQLAKSDAQNLPIRKPVRPLPEPQVSNQTREYLLDELHDSIQRCPGQKLNAEVQRQLAVYRQSEFDVVDGLRDLYRLNGTVQERTIILLALREVGTSQATSLIQEIASEPGNDAATLGPRAVKLLSSMGADTDRLSQLLKSSSAETRDSAAMELAGKELTATAVERLGELLKSDSWEAHSFVISAFTSDRSSKHARRKLELLIAALARLDKLDDEPQVDLCSRSPRSLVMCGYVTTLAHMLGADEIVHEQLSRANAGSIEYKVLAIASAMRKDKSARPALLEIARKEKNDDLRHMAVVGLQFVGNKQDLEFLRKLAMEDPYVLQVRVDYKPQAIDVQFPVRSAAKQAIGVLSE